MANIPNFDANNISNGPVKLKPWRVTTWESYNSLTKHERDAIWKEWAWNRHPDKLLRWLLETEGVDRQMLNRENLLTPIAGNWRSMRG